MLIQKLMPTRSSFVEDHFEPINTPSGHYFLVFIGSKILLRLPDTLKFIRSASKRHQAEGVIWPHPREAPTTQL
jgi:hypothetical protein